MEATPVRGRKFSYSHTLGNLTMFRYPVDVGLDADNNVYVVNRGHDGDWVFGVNKITIDEDEIGRFGGEGDTDGRFRWPTAIVIDSQGLAYVADEWHNRISIFDTKVEFNGGDVEEGNFLRKWGVAGTEPGQLGKPAGMVLDANEDLYITEQDNNRVAKFTREGEFLMTFGRPGSGPGEFNKPWGINIDGDGNLYVADWNNHRIQKFTADGQFLQTIGEAGSGAGKLRRPSDVAIDADGDIYVTDWGQNKVEVYDAEGGHLTTLYGDHNKLSPRSQLYLDLNAVDSEKRALVTNFDPERYFDCPTAVEIDRDGRIIIVDNVRLRLQVYRKEMQQAA